VLKFHLYIQNLPDLFKSVMWTSLVAQVIKDLPTKKETQVQSLGREDPLEKRIVTHFNILAWGISGTEELRLQSMGSQRVEHN
jgi:nicotinamide mononucleotide adenylyltransferase